MSQLRTAVGDPADVDTALLHGAVANFAEEAAVLLLVKLATGCPSWASADLITLLPETDGGGLWAQIAWPDLEPALSDGLIVGSSGQLPVLRAAKGIGDGPVHLGDLAAGLDRRSLTLQLAAIAHAAGSHDHRDPTYAPDGIPHAGDPLPPLVAWPPRE